MKREFSGGRGWRLKGLLLLALFLTISSFSQANAGNDYDLFFCHGCTTSSDFERAADNAIRPGFWNALAYVANPATKEVRAFVVQRIPETVGPGGPGFGEIGAGYETIVSQNVPDAHRVSQIVDAIEALDELRVEFISKAIPVEDLDLPIPIESVVEIIGVGPPQLRLSELQDAVNDHHTSWWRTALIQVEEMVSAIIESKIPDFFGESKPLEVIVEFEDGSFVTLELSHFAVDHSFTNYMPRYEVDVSTARLENGQQVPHDPVMLAGFGASSEYLSETHAETLVSNLGGSCDIEAETDWVCDEDGCESNLVSVTIRC